MTRGPHTQLTFPELFQLPCTVNLRTAAQAIGVSMGTAYRLVGRGDFPCAVLRPGYRYIVPMAGLLEALGIENVPVHLEHVDRGAAFATLLD